MMTSCRQSSLARAQRGLSLVELMVGITVGLFVVAAAATVVANQLGDNRRLLLETQVQQDLRSAMDIITSQLRRAGAGTVNNVQASMAASPVAGGASNPFSGISTTSGPASEVEFKFYLEADQQGPFGFKLQDDTLKSRMRATGGVSGTQWQELTDKNVLKVTAFTITPRTVTSAVLPCPKLCANGTSSCWPTLAVRSYVVSIEAEAKSDPSVRRALRNEVRVRNDVVNFNGSTPASPVCPT